jgi:2-keto-4-pentenoate hydratase/2-oxohepta-3-ene-1,7-dioic acid hydratase in catechol pathway
MQFERSSRTIKFGNTEIPEPRVLLDFLGFEKHLVQIRAKRGTTIWPGWFDHAAYYSIDLPPEKIYESGDEVPIPAFIQAPDYEFEIGCIVTKYGKPANMAEAIKFFQEHCYLTILNDWSARDIQKKDSEGLGPTHSKSIMGKSLGPSVVPVSNYKLDENGVMSMEMVLKVNGQERSRSNYDTIYHTHPTTNKKQAWSFPRIMAWLSQANIALYPGYIIGSGTVGNGCIAEFSAKVHPQTGEVIEPATYPWLKDGDVVTMEAEGIGVLENKVKITADKLVSVK